MHLGDATMSTCRGAGCCVQAGLDALLAVFLPLLRLVLLRDLAAHVSEGGAPPGLQQHGDASIWPLFAGGIGNPVSVIVGNWIVRLTGNVA